MAPDAPALLTNARRGLLRLHKTLLDWERSNYERTHDRQSTRRYGQALQENPETVFAHRDLMASLGGSRQDERRASE